MTTEPIPMVDPRQQRSKNIRTGLVLASIALAVFIGFLVKQALFG
ncbi:MAG: cytochrome oxidase small assembly protein [Burkholderiaceae bacterium]|jgi:hypothetical protein|nr:cytochrome oxidase small assembly protein [Burkholderiaceae bacterium]MEB2320361.1 cytochrome oxidase small assembly protein [Pseudomonadota bacterium]